MFFKAAVTRVFLLQFSLLGILFLPTFSIVPVLFSARICRAGQRETIYLSKDLAPYYNQLQNLPMLEAVIRSEEDFVLSVEVETQSGLQPTVWIDYFSGEGSSTLTQGGVIRIPLGKLKPSEWATLQRDVAGDLQLAHQTFSSIRRVSLRGSRFDVRTIRFFSDSDELLIDFPSQDGKTIFALGWNSNDNRNCFQIVQAQGSTDDPDSYLRVESITSPGTGTSAGTGTGTLPASTNFLLPDINTGFGSGGWHSGVSDTGWYSDEADAWRYSSSGYYSPLGFYPSPFMPFSPLMSPFSPFGMGFGGPFGMGYGLFGAPLLAMGAFGPPLGGLGGLGLFGGLGGMGGLGLFGLGGGLPGLSSIPNPLWGTSTGDTFYNKLFDYLFEGAVPVSTAAIIIEPPVSPPSTVLPTTVPVPAVATTPLVAPTIPLTGGPGGGGGGGGGGGFGGGGGTGGIGGIGGGGGGVIP
ncbi:MAG: hypothetical protein AB1611_20860 [bacterium]